VKRYIGEQLVIIKIALSTIIIIIQTECRKQYWDYRAGDKF